MVNNEELEKQLALLEDGEIIEGSVIFKDDLSTVSVYIALKAYVEDDDEVNDDDIFFYCDRASEVRGLCDPDNGEDFVLLSFHGRKADYSTFEVLNYKADGWTLRLEGSTVGGEWTYTAIDPNGKSYTYTNEWSFEDSDGNQMEAPIIPDREELVFDAVNCLSSAHNLTDLPEKWELGKED